MLNVLYRHVQWALAGKYLWKGKEMVKGFHDIGHDVLDVLFKKVFLIFCLVSSESPK
jgi:hypothetical protein